MNSPTPSTFEIRRAVASEAAALSELARRSKAYWGYSEEFMRSCEAELPYGPERIEGALIGQGLGRALVDHGKSTVRALRGESLVIQGDPHAKGFCLAVGGEQIGMRASASIPDRHLPLFRISVSRGPME